VLNLSMDSLTKEIKLTQELMELFIKYQIPSDLLSYDEQSGNEDGFEAVATSSVRLSSVKENVRAMNEMIKAAKDEELSQRKQEAKFAAFDSFTYSPSPVSGTFVVCRD
jgi:protein subunit release factor A